MLSALADGPIGVTEVADRVELPKSTVARLLASLQREGAVEQEPGGTRYRVGSRIVTLAATVLPTRSMVVLARPELEALALSDRRGGRPVRPGGLPGPLRRPGRYAQSGLGPGLDGDPRADACRAVRAGPAGPPVAGQPGALPGPADGGVHAGHGDRPGHPPRAPAPGPARRLRLGLRRVLGGDQLGRGGRGQRGWRGRGRGPSPRPVLPLPRGRDPGADRLRGRGRGGPHLGPDPPGREPATLIGQSPTIRRNTVDEVEPSRL